MADDLSGPQKAAIMLLSLGENFAADVFKKLDDAEVKEIGRQMSLIRNIPKDVVEKTVTEFNDLLGSEMDVVVKGDEFVKRALTNAKGDNATLLLEEIERDKPPVPFKNLKDINPAVLGNFIKNEHPQTIAVILAHLSSAVAAEILRQFPENLQYEVVLRVATLGKRSARGAVGDRRRFGRGGGILGRPRLRRHNRRRPKRGRTAQPR